MVPYSQRFVSHREPGPGTMTGAGDIIVDNYGNRYRVLDAGEAQSIRNSTGGQVYTIGWDGSIR